MKAVRVHIAARTVLAVLLVGLASAAWDGNASAPATSPALAYDSRTSLPSVTAWTTASGERTLRASRATLPASATSAAITV